MTTPVGARAAVQIVGDASQLGKQIEADANKALRSIKLDLGQVTDQISRAFDKATNSGAAELNKLGPAARQAFGEIAKAADNAFDATIKDSLVAGEGIKEGVQTGVEGAGNALGDELRSGVVNALAGAELVANAAADALSAGIDEGVDGIGSEAAREIVTDEVLGLEAGRPLVAAAGVQLGRAVSEGMATETGRVTATGGTLAAAARTGIISAVTAIGAGLTALTGFGLNAAGQMEQTQVALESLTGSAAKGQKTFAALQKFAAETPFEFSDVTPIAQQFLAFAGSVGLSQDQLIPFLGTLGDISSVTGAGTQGMHSVALALGQIASAGKLSVGDIRQVATNLPGFNAVAAVAAARGESTAQAMEEISAGTISADEGIKALLQGMKQFPGAAGAMQKQSETLLGVLSTFKDVSKQALVGAFAPVIPQIKESLAAITPIVGEAFNTLAPALGKVAAQLLPFVANLLQGLTPVLEPILSALAEGLEAVGPSLKPLGAAFGQLVGAVAPVLGPLGQFVAVVATAIAPAIAAAAPLLGSLAALFTQLIGQAEPLIAALGAGLGQVLLQLAEAVAPLVLQFVSEFAQTLIPLTPLILEVLTAVLQLAPSLLQLLVPSLELVLAILQPLVPLIPTLAQLFVSGLVPAISGIAAALGVLAPAISWLADFFREDPQFVYVLVTALGVWLAATNAMNVAYGIFEAGLKGFLLVMELVDLAMDANPAVLLAIAVLAVAAAVIYAWNHFAAFRDVVIAVWDAVVGAAEAVGGALATAFDAVVDALSDAYDAVVDFIGDVGDFFGSLPGVIGGALATAGKAVLEFFSNLPRYMLDALLLGIQGLFIGIGIIIGVILAIFIGGFKAIIYEWNNFPAQVVAVVTAAVQGIIDGFNNAVAFVRGMITNIASSITGFISDIADGVVQGAVNLVLGLQQQGSAIGDWIRSLPGKVLDAAVAFSVAFAQFWQRGRQAAIDGVVNIAKTIAGLPAKLIDLGPKLFAAGVQLILSFFKGLGNFGAQALGLGKSIVNGIVDALNWVLHLINKGLDIVDNYLPFELPKFHDIPKLARGGLTQTTGAAILHPTEAVLPLEDARTTDLLARSLAEAQASLRTVGTPTVDAGAIYVNIQIGERELEDIVATAIDENNRQLKVRVMSGSGRRRG